jgi:transcriptional regulator with XRE-family HTH domain
MQDTTKTPVYECVRQFRAALNLSTRQFAAALGVTHPSVIRWEKEEESPSRQSLISLASLAARNGYADLSEAFTILLSADRLGRLYAAFRLVYNQVGLLEGLLKHVDLLIESDPVRAKIMLAEAIRRAAEARTDLAKDCPQVAQKKPEYRGTAPVIPFRSSAPTVN